MSPISQQVSWAQFMSLTETDAAHLMLVESETSLARRFRGMKSARTEVHIECTARARARIISKCICCEKLSYNLCPDARNTVSAWNYRRSKFVYSCFYSIRSDPMHAASQIAATASVIECASRNTINAIEIDILRVVCVGWSNVVCLEFAKGPPQTDRYRYTTRPWFHVIPKAMFE